MNHTRKRKKKDTRVFHRSGRKRSVTIFVRMMVLLLAVLLVQMSVYLLFFIKGGLVDETEENAFLVMSQRVANREQGLENNMIHRWTNTGECVGSIQEIITDILEENDATAAMLSTDEKLCQDVISASSASIISMLRHNGVTGAFLILDCPDASNNYPGLYIRDYDPDSYLGNNQDLLMERGQAGIAQQAGIEMDKYWRAQVSFGAGAEERSQFFLKPLNAAKAASAQDRATENFCYWSMPFSLSEVDREVVTYSIPLIYEDGTVMGVLGIDVTTEWMRNFLNYDELSEDKAGAYYLGVSLDGGKTYEKVCTNGPSFHELFGIEEEAVTATSTDYDNIMTLEGSQAGGDTVIYAAVKPLALYGAGTPFETEQWALIGILDSDHLLTFSQHVTRLAVLSALASLALGIVFIFFAGRVFIRPINSLMLNLLSANHEPNKPITLPHTGLSEIDTLSRAIELQSETALRIASRTSKIISMTNIPIGLFEYNNDASHVFCSQSLFTVLGWSNPQEGDTYLPRKEFFARFQMLRKDLVDGQRLVYQIKDSKSGTSRWVQLFCREESDASLGAVLDVTEEIESVRRMEYERDYDMLTGIFNRRAFDQKMENLFAPERHRELKIAALLMFDLDNLKFVNDSYGHEYGDQYIKAFSQYLRYFSKWPSVVARRSGDEFNVFLYGFSSHKELRQIVADFWREGKTRSIELPDGGNLNVRASGGLAWYPHDANTFEMLLRFADFAMYDSKNTVKGELREFDQQEYAKKSIFINGQDALNRLIDDHLVRYAFQPIVSAIDGSVFGYELLMRPTLEKLSNLETLFRLAKSQSKLYQMERLTWVEAMSAFSWQVEQGNMNENQWAFINSIASQVLSPEDFAEIEGRYSALCPRVIMEITESDELNAAAVKVKCDTVRRWNGKIALDDFGSGYNHEATMVDLAPDVIKVDMSIIRGIDQNENRQLVLENFVRYAKQRNILVLAEGVETREELETVIRMDVDLLQGYYLARPTIEIAPLPDAVTQEIRIFRNRYHE